MMRYSQKMDDEIKCKAKGKVVAISISREKGVSKENVYNVKVLKNYGIEGDAHAGHWHRQISFLDTDTLKMVQNRLGRKILPGELAENITVDVSLSDVKVGDIMIAGQCVFEATQIGKKCHSGCAIFKKIGDCEMRKRGIFARVLKGGLLHIGDEVIVLDRL